MKLGKVGIAFPHVNYKIKITHRTQRKATAPEWLLLKIAQMSEEHPTYKEKSLNDLLESRFFIADSDKLLRQVLIDLIDANALEHIPKFGDESDWNRLRCGDLKLTKDGRRLQREGKLPSQEKPADISVVYDVVNGRIVKEDKTLSDDTAYIKIRDISANNLPGFPSSLIREHLETSQQAPKNPYTWLQKNSLIDSIVPTKALVKWKNGTRHILADDNGNLSLQDEPDAGVVDTVLKAYEFGTMPDCELPDISVSELETKKSVQPYDKVEESILAADEETQLFLLAPQFEKIVGQLNQKICIVTEQNSFGLEVIGDNTFIRIPNFFKDGLCYQDSQRIISAAALKLHWSDMSWRVPFIYETDGDFAPLLLELAKKYFLEEPRILKLLQFVPNAPWREFYTEEFIRMKLNSPPTETLTPADKIFERLPKILAKATNILPNLSERADCNEIRLALREKNAETLHDIHDLVSQWNNALNSLREETSTDLNSIDWKDAPFGNSLKFMLRVEEAISLFFDRAGENFDKVYVLESEALLHYPALLDDFTKNREMVIVPEAVLAELNALAQSEETATNAARAIQKIAEHRDDKWLNLNEKYPAELFGDDIREFPILSTIFKYKIKKPVLVTDNKIITEFAASRGIKVITAHNLHEKIGGSSKGKTKITKRNGRQ